MNKLLLVLAIFCLAGPNILQAQKAKFKSKICTVQKTRLPVNYSEPDQRSYDIITKGSYAGNVEAHGKKLYGWEKDMDSPDIKAVVSIYGYSVSSPKKHSEKKQKKDKDGKVTDSWTEYWYSASATGKATLYVYGYEQPFEYRAKPKKKSKYEQKQEAKAEAAKKDLEDNPFLTKEVIAEAEESDIGADEGLEGANLPLVNTLRVDKSKDIVSRRSRSASDAYKDYTNNQRPKLDALKNEYPDAAYKSAMHNLNLLYGFAPVNQRFYLKTMKSDKHSEFKTWNDACQATVTIFKTFNFNESIDESSQSFNAIVDYFADQVNSIPDNDKKQWKHKKAALQNLLNILFYLDRHDDVIAWSEKFLDNKKLDNLSKNMMAQSEKQKAHLAFHNMATSHFETNDEIDSDDIEVAELAADDDDEEGGK